MRHLLSLQPQFLVHRSRTVTRIMSVSSIRDVSTASTASSSTAFVGGSTKLEVTPAGGWPEGMESSGLMEAPGDIATVYSCGGR